MHMNYWVNVTYFWNGSHFSKFLNVAPLSTWLSLEPSYLTQLCDRYRVPKFPHSSATFNIISGFCIPASPKVLQGAFGDSACPTWGSQPCPMLANRHLTGLTWFPIVLYLYKVGLSLY